MPFIQKEPNSLPENYIQAIGDEWMLIAAGNSSKYNMMTASWGFTGVMWGKPCAIAAIRPQRYTKELVDANDYFTLSFYGADKAVHAVCGKESGRTVDKTALTGLTPLFDDETGAPYFEQARLVFICKKLYTAPLTKGGFTAQGAEIPGNFYAANDFHEMYYGEIVKALVKE